MLLFPNALCCSLYERNCVCAVFKIFSKFLPANNFCQLLRVTRKRSFTSASNAQAQLHFRDDQQRAFGISSVSNSRFCWNSRLFFTHEHLEGVGIPDFFCRNFFGIPGFCLFLFLFLFCFFFLSTALGIPDTFIKPVLEFHVFFFFFFFRGSDII